MGYFGKLREKQSRFYRRLWQELEEIKVIDTHEHISSMPILKEDHKINLNEEKPIPIPGLFQSSYIKGMSKNGDYKKWARELLRFRGTGYLRAWLIALEDLYDIEPTINPNFVKEVNEKVNHAYRDDLEHNTHHHITEVMDKMNVEYAINNIGIDEHLRLPQPRFKGAAGIPSILEGMKVPSDSSKSGKAVYWFAKEKLGMNYSDIQTLEDYCEVTDKLLAYFRDSGNYICYKTQMAYNRPLWFPEPDDNEEKYENMFNTYPRHEEQAWEFGTYMFHHILEWAAFEWNVPFQIHTGLARIYDGGSNALNLSHLMIKFPDIHFDLFHGNYPYDNLPGMLHQIYNISADLCWLPAISPIAAQRTLTEIFEVGDMVAERKYHQPSLRTCLYGGDSRVIEGSYGALQIAKDVLIRSLEDLYERGHIMEMDAIDLAENVLYNNPKRIFNL